jgi:hypothetical protein
MTVHPARRLIVASVGIGAAVALSLSVWATTAMTAPLSAHGSLAGCAAKVTKLKGHLAVVNCGPAVATLRISGKTYTFRNGTCRTRANGLPVDQLGTAVVGVKNNGGYSNFDLEAETKDNTSVSANSGPLHLSALLGKSSGSNIISFSGHSASSNVSFSGSVNCHGVIQKVH